MTTTVVRTLPSIHRSREQRITEAVRTATSCDGTIDDALTLLALVGTASVAELAGGDGEGASFDALSRAQTLCHVVGVALRRFDERTRVAPPAALRELLSDAAVPCRNATCDATVLPWTEECCGYCTDECERNDSDARARL